MDPSNRLQDQKRAEAGGGPIEKPTGTPSPSHDPALTPNPRLTQPTGPAAPQVQPAADQNPAGTKLPSAPIEGAMGVTNDALIAGRNPQPTIPVDASGKPQGSEGADKDASTSTSDTVKK